MSAARMDGRTARSQQTRHKIVEACRRWMVEGVFQPSIALTARRAQVSVRSVFQHFKSVEGLHAAALDQDVVIHLHRQLELLKPTDLVKAVVAGRLPQ